jgi:hypothetical protein
MRSNQVFARMTPEQSQRFLAEIKQEAPEVARLALAAAAGAFKLRHEFLKRQPRARQAEWVRRALGRNVGAAAAEEVLATYFLEIKLDLLTELLDAFGLEHEEGSLLAEDPPCPDRQKLDAVVKEFREGEEPETRELLLQAFAAQSAIDWPEFEALLGFDAAE